MQKVATSYVGGLTHRNRDDTIDDLRKKIEDLTDFTLSNSKCVKKFPEESVFPD